MKQKKTEANCVHDLTCKFDLNLLGACNRLDLLVPALMRSTSHQKWSYSSKQFRVPIVIL